MYLKATFTGKADVLDVSEIMIAILQEFPFHTFSEEENILFAYGEKDDFTEEIKLNIQEVISSFSDDLTFEDIEKENWNEEWEKNYFKPIWIENEVCVYAPFHTLEKEPKIPIIIEPKMSFGTGHHATTHLMCAAILKLRAQMNGARVLDMGSGTGILAILAAKLGARFVHAIDIEEWCKENAEENFDKNGVDQFQSDMGNVELLHAIPEPFDVIFANIQRNVLLADMAAYSKILIQKGYLFISGFPPEDAKSLIDHAKNINLNHLFSEVKGDWCCIGFAKD
jgi:ribosomal protein L11 methyltransferase